MTDTTMRGPVSRYIPMTKGRAESLGYACGLYGATTLNCNIQIFSCPIFTSAWERGFAAGRREVLGDDQPTDATDGDGNDD